MAKRKLKQPNIVETCDHDGVHFEIEDKGGVYFVRYRDRKGQPATAAPYFSIEKAREGFKQHIDRFMPRPSVLD